MPNKHWLNILRIPTSARQATIWIASSIYPCDNNFSTGHPNQYCSSYHFILLVYFCGEIPLLLYCDSGCHIRLLPLLSIQFILKPLLGNERALYNKLSNRQVLENMRLLQPHLLSLSQLIFISLVCWFLPVVWKILVDPVFWSCHTIHFNLSFQVNIRSGTDISGHE